MSQPTKTSTSQLPVGSRILIPTETTSRKSSPTIVLLVKEMNIDAVRSFMLECLVPILAEEFLQLRGHADIPQIEPASCKPTFQPLGKETVR